MLPCCPALDKVRPYSADVIRDELNAINGRRTNQALQDIKDVVDLLENNMNLHRRLCYGSTRPPGTNHTHDAPVGGACSLVILILLSLSVVADGGMDFSFLLFVSRMRIKLQVSLPSRSLDCGRAEGRT